MATAETDDRVTAPPRPISLDEYKQMAEDGRLGPDDRIELLDGVPVKKMNKGLRHVAIARRLQDLVKDHLSPDFQVFKEDPIELPGGPDRNTPSLPEPDLVVVRGGPRTFETRYPLPDDLVLAVEVASNSRMLSRDRAGLARYAWNRVPCVWVVNLAANVIEVYSNPTGPEPEPVYQSVEVRTPGQTVKIPLGDDLDLNLDVNQILA